LHHITGRDVTYVGGDFTQHQHIAAMPEIELGLSIDANPLLRLFYDSQVVDEWLAERKQHLEQTLIPAQRPTSSIPDLTRMWTEATDFTGDRAKFMSRLDDHLSICKQRLLDNALATFYQSGHNRVIFKVVNPTDDPVKAVRVAASFYAGDAVVLSSAPDRYPMPDAPKWPDPMERMLGHALATSEMAYAFWPKASALPSDARIRNDNGFVQIEYLIGDLRPRQDDTTEPVVIIPFLGELEELEITLTVHAIDRRGVKKEDFVLPIQDRGFLLGDVVSPDY
jgi:hypothetical protein